MDPGAKSLPKLLNTILNSFMDLCHCDGGSIFTLRKGEDGKGYLAFETMVTRSLKLTQVPDHLKNMTFTLDSTTLVGTTAITRQFQTQKFEEPKSGGAKKVTSALKYHTRNILSGPLVTPRGDLVGVVQLLNKLPHANATANIDFDQRDEHLFSVVAGQAALAIENSILMDEQEKLIEGFVNACVTAVEARDPVTSGHSARVSDYTLSLASAINRTGAGPLGQLHFSDMQLREIRFAAMLHDIGKISVREEVLSKEKKLMPYELEVIRMRLKLIRANLKVHSMVTGKDVRTELGRVADAWALISSANEPTLLPAAVSSAIRDLGDFSVIDEDGERIPVLTPREGYQLAVPKGSLTAEERIEIEKHVSHTYEILKMVPWSRGLERVPEIAFMHHEKLDGTGYPLHRGAEVIPIQSRMLTVCDIYDALTADDRPYKKAVPQDRAIGILEDEVKSGKLDPELLRIFVEARVYAAVKKSSKKTGKKAA